MNQDPLVSVITPFYNEEKFLKEAIESVISQDYQHWELLLVDDGSNDASTEIAKSYAISNPGKIFYIEHPDHINKGLCASRNLALTKARGDFIALLDADDVWLKQKLSSQVQIFKQHP
ncbi:MAG TPA: glycosyltransferase family 2 protein [Flavisolibacter sp.]|nr:glycosyltransferase family 2 protein [Flavisolibacter sp.]